MSVILKWFRWLHCDHDWQPKYDMDIYRTVSGENRLVGINHIKECSKCRRIWTQQVRI